MARLTHHGDRRSVANSEFLAICNFNSGPSDGAVNRDGRVYVERPGLVRQP